MFVRGRGGCRHKRERLVIGRCGGGCRCKRAEKRERLVISRSGGMGGGQSQTSWSKMGSRWGGCGGGKQAQACDDMSGDEARGEEGDVRHNKQFSPRHRDGLEMFFSFFISLPSTLETCRVGQNLPDAY